MTDMKWKDVCESIGQWSVTSDVFPIDIIFPLKRIMGNTDQ